MTVGERIKQLREERGWRPSYLAMELGCSQSAIYYYEAGRNKRYIKILILACCYVFGITREEFMKGVDRD